MKAILASKARNPAFASRAVSEVPANGYLTSSNQMKDQIIKEKEYVKGTGLLHQVVPGRAVLSLPTSHSSATIPDLGFLDKAVAGHAVLNLHFSCTIPDLYQPYPGLLNEDLLF